MRSLSRTICTTTLAAAVLLPTACAPPAQLGDGEGEREDHGEGEGEGEDDGEGEDAPSRLLTVVEHRFAIPGERVAGVADLTGDGRDDVVVADVDADTLLVFAGPLQAASAPYAQLTTPAGRVGAAALTAIDVTLDGAADLLAADLFDGALHVVPGPLTAGTATLADVGSVVQGAPFSFFASSIAHVSEPPLLAVATPGEPEEACYSARGAHVVPLPLLAGAVDELAVAATSGIDPFLCPGQWLGLQDVIDDASPDLLLTTDTATLVFRGPLSGALGEADAALAMPHTSRSYGYGHTTPALVVGDELLLQDGEEIVAFALPLADVAPARHAVAGLMVQSHGDLDGDGRPELVTIDAEPGSTTLEVRRAAPLEPAVVFERVGAFHGIAVGDVLGDARAELLLLDEGGLVVLSLCR